MARKYSYNTSADALLKPAKNAVFFEDWDSIADNRNHDLLCAEMSRLAYASETAVIASLAKAGFSLIGFVGGESLTARIAGRGTQGFVAKSSTTGVSVLAFRGTESDKFEDIFSDLGTMQVDFPDGGRVHSGFMRAYVSARERIAALLQLREGSLLITGHSLGAALATLAATEFAPAALITFGSPRVGDTAFCEFLHARLGRQAVHRFVNCCDVVGRLPPERFDAAHFSALFEELAAFERFSPLMRVTAEGVTKAAAGTLARLFATFRLAVEFDHAGSLRYVRGDGTVMTDPSALEQTQDQRATRLAYPHSLEAGLAHLAALFRAVAVPTGTQTVLRAFGHGLFGLIRGDPVPLRDLADHAPINYLSAIMGRV